MTKFIDKLDNAKFQGVSNSEIIYLMRQLEFFIESNKKLISIIVDHFQKSKKTYSIVELSDEIVMVLNLSKVKEVILNVGYPFPIYSEDKSGLFIGIANNVRIKMFIRGEVLRKLQRNYLKKVFLGSLENKKWTVVDEIEKFRKISANLLKKRNKIIYIDPYHFIGDAFTGLHFLEQFQAQSTITNIVVLSRFFKHLKLFYKSCKKNVDILRKECIENSVIIMPDLIDNHFGENIKLLEGIIGENVVVFLPGRNLIIHYQKNKVDIYHYNKKDVLLRNKNIEDYMDDCLNPFFESQYYNYGKRNKSRKNGVTEIFVNPYSSNSLKEIKVELFLKIAIDLIKNNNIRFVISSNNGAAKGKNDWIDKFILKIKKEKYKSLLNNTIFLSDNNISDLGKKLLKRGVSCTLTADTSISHMLSKIMIPNITIYNEKFWDRESGQSLSAESPLGFCRYNLPQFAAILTENGDPNNFSDGIKNGLQTLLNVAKVGDKTLLGKIPQEIHNFYKMIRGYVKYPSKSLNYRNHKKLYAEYLILKKHFVYSEFAWLFDIYDPDRLTIGINKDTNKNNCFLIYSSWKNLPLYKFINYFGY